MIVWLMHRCWNLHSFSIVLSNRLLLRMKRKTDCHSRLHGFAMTKRYVILSACAKESVISLKRERIAAGLKPLAMTRRRENGLPQPFTRLSNDKKTGCICSPFNNLFSHAKAAEYFICYLVCNAPAGKLKQGGQRVVHANAHRV